MIPFSRLYPPCHYSLQYDYSKHFHFTLEYMEVVHADETKFSPSYIFGGACFILSTTRRSAYGNYQDGFAVNHTYCH